MLLMILAKEISKPMQNKSKENMFKIIEMSFSDKYKATDCV